MKIIVMFSLLEALDSLDAEGFGNLFDDSERGIKKATEHFTRWMISWCHLPLSICRLGGNSGQSFARSYRHIALGLPWMNNPTEMEIKYAEELRADFNNSNSNDFRLYNLLVQNANFQQEFDEFCKSASPQLHLYPHTYEFVKIRIYFLVIHQQQVEGLFNKLDLKTHPNMKMDLKESKLRLTALQINKRNLQDGLEKVRSQRCNSSNILHEAQESIFGKDQALCLFNQMFKK